MPFVSRSSPMVRVAVRGIRAHKFRLVATMLAVLLGVSFMCGTAILGDTVKSSFDEVFVDIYARIDVVVRSDQTIGRSFGTRRDRVPEAIVSHVAAVPGVAAAEGQVEGQLRVIDARGKPMYNPQASPPTLALNWPRVAPLNGWTLVDGRPPSGDEVVVDRRTATEGGYKVGDMVKLAVASGIVERPLVGIGTFSGLDTYSGGAAVLMDAPAAEQLVGEPGKFDRINVVAAPGEDDEVVASRIRALGLPQTDVMTGAAFTAERQDLFGQFISLFTQLISAFGGIALFVGMFIIYNTFTIIVAQRTRELALLRAVGASRRQVLSSVLIEATAVGAIASALGVVAGWGVAYFLRWLIQRLGFDLPDTPLTIDPVRFVLPVSLAMLVTIVSAAVPAWRASKTMAIAAFREASVDRNRHPLFRLAIALPFVAAAVLVLRWAFETTSELAPGYVLLAAVPAITAVAIVGPVLIPPVVLKVGRPLPWFTGITGRLAQRNAIRNPSRTSTTACALLIGVSLVCVITVAAASLSATVARTVERTVPGDYVVTTDSFLGMSPTIAGKLAAIDGVQTASGVRRGPVRVKGSDQFAIAVDPESSKGVVDLEVRSGSLDGLGPQTVAVAASQADRDGVKVGDRLPIRFLAGEEKPFEVVAIYGRSLTRNGEYLFAHSGWDPNVPEALRVDGIVYVELADGADVGGIRPKLDAAVADNPTVEVLNVNDFKERQANQVVRRISYLYALLALALIIGVLGIVNTLLLSVHERTRELGLLRTVGARRRQLGSSILQEAVVIAALGAIAGVVLGVILGWAMVQTLTFDEVVLFNAPVGWLTAIAVGSGAAGLLAGLYPAWRAGRLDVLESIATE